MSYIDTSKNIHNDFQALSIYTHSDQMSKLQKLHLSVKQAPGKPVSEGKIGGKIHM